MKIGVLGGTFDPVHRGHILMAEAAAGALDLEEVLMVPAGQPMSKKESILVTPEEHRLEMLRLAIEDRPKLKISTIEIERAGPSYTADTLVELQKRYTGDDLLYFILGWDSLAYLHEWHKPEEILARCHLVAIPRPGFSRPDMKTLEKNLPGISGRVIFLNEPRVDISASAIRELAARGEPIDQLVPAAVAQYIKEHKLYRKT